MNKEQAKKEWVLSTQLVPRHAPLPKTSKDIPETGVQAWFKPFKGRQAAVIIRKMESEFFGGCPLPA